MKINKDSLNFEPDEIAAIEKHYNAEYICDSDYLLDKEDGRYAGGCFSYFWTPKAHPEGSNYFCLFFNEANPFDSRMSITNGINILEQAISGIVVHDEVFFSRHRHDFRKIGDCFIDGGRNYTRIGGDNVETVTLKVNPETHSLEILKKD